MKETLNMSEEKSTLIITNQSIKNALIELNSIHGSKDQQNLIKVMADI